VCVDRWFAIALLSFESCRGHMIDEYEFVVHPRLVGHGPTLFAGLSKHIDLKLVSRLEFGSGAVAMRYEPRRWPSGLLAW
jgi:dihydrofolate reductase